MTRPYIARYGCSEERALVGIAETCLWSFTA